MLQPQRTQKLMLFFFVQYGPIPMYKRKYLLLHMHITFFLWIIAHAFYSCLDDIFCFFWLELKVKILL